MPDTPSMSDMPARDPSPKPFFSEVERLRLLEANITDYAIFMIDTHERIASWNAGAERIAGYEEAEILGRPASIIFTPEDRDSGAAQQEFRTARATGRSEDERWQQRKDGSRFWAMSILTALFDAQGQPRGYAKILRDFTARKQYEEQIQALNARLRWAMTETHHRVKNSLQIISAMIDFQTVGRSEAVPVGEYKRLSTQVRALSAVHDLLTEDTKAGGDATAIALPGLLETLLSLIQSTAGHSRIVHQFEEARVSTRKGSSIALVVNELVTNAIKHGHGRVWVTLTAPERNATLSVCDDGPGFPEGFQVQRFSHTGLELVEQLTRLDLRGEARYENRPEGGGCVRVLFRTDR